MPLDADLLDLMPSSVTVYPFLTDNKYNESSYSPTGTAYACHIQGKQRLVRTRDNREAVAVLDVYVDATTITDRDKVVLPFSTPSGNPYILLGVSTGYDDQGALYQVLHFGDALSHRNLG